MARTYWDIDEWTSGDVWSSLTTIEVPNSDLTEDIVSTMTKIGLADGNVARMIPETTSLAQPLAFSWTFLDNLTLYTNLLSWVNTTKYLRINTNLSGVEFIGYFTSVRRVWMVAQTEWQITAAFDVRDL